MADRQALFTTGEAAAYLRYEPTTLAIWRSQAKGPAYIKIGRTIRYRRRDLDEWVDGGPAIRMRIEETADCHIEKRKLTKRLRGRAAVALCDRHLAAEPNCRDCRDRDGIERPAAEVDHVVALADGGTNSPDNLRSLCRSCHTVRTREWLRRKL